MDEFRKIGEKERGIPNIGCSDGISVCSLVLEWRNTVWERIIGIR